MAKYRARLLHTAHIVDNTVVATPEPLSPSPTTLADRLLDELQNAIVEGDLQPGEKLREPDLAKRFGTSRGPLRDALRRLEAR
ncbi:MAG: GntR family transcriptional regulator, partial [Pseudomonadota bacterium]